MQENKKNWPLRRIYNSLLLLKAIVFGFLLSFYSCDIIEAPYTEGNPIDTALCPPQDFQANSNHIRKVLVEDYTGHTCGNCPRAAEMASTLLNTYGEQAVVIAVHVGFFAEPKHYPDSSYSKDYRTVVGNELNDFFGNDAAGLPNGMINRKVVSSSPILSYNSWTSVFASEVALAPMADIYIKPQYDIDENTVCADVKVEFLTDLSEEYKLCVFLTEDSISDWQKDYSLNPADIPNYVHRHMLRASFNGTWGQPIGPEPITNGSSDIKRYSIGLDNSWVPSKLHIVAFVYNATNYEIIQAEETSIE